MDYYRPCQNLLELWSDSTCACLGHINLCCLKAACAAKLTQYNMLYIPDATFLKMGPSDLQRLHLSETLVSLQHQQHNDSLVRNHHWSFDSGRRLSPYRLVALHALLSP
jgi:hypothetical protein